MIMIMGRITVFLLVLFSFGVPSASAQFGSSDQSLLADSSNLSVVLEPELPEPNQTYTASVPTYGRVAGAGITWFYNGSEIPDSKNSNQVTLVAPEDGETDNLVVVFNQTDNEIVIEKPVRPRYLDIIIEPQTHVPSFYLGRPLASIGSTVNATAILSGEESPANLIYTWRNGREVIGGGSLRGNDAISFEVGWDRNIILDLTITNLAGEPIAKKYVVVPSVSPVVKFYESSSLLGLNNRSIGDTLNLIGNSTVIKAEPYYLDSRVYNSPSILEWSIDRVDYPVNQSNPYEVTLQKNDSAGTSQLNFHVRDTNQVLQGVRANLNINI